MNRALDRIARSAAKTPFSRRYIKLLRADIPPEIRDSVMFNIIEWQWKKGELREDRQYKTYNKEKPMSNEAFVANEAAIMANKSDGAVLAQLVVFKAENSLDMDEVGDVWFAYVTEGGSRP